MSNPATMFLIMEEKVQVLARDKRPVEEEGTCCGCVGQVLGRHPQEGPTGTAENDASSMHLATSNLKDEVMF